MNMINRSTPEKKQKNVLLLLYGGKDSHASISDLQETGYTVFALCIDGIIDNFYLDTDVNIKL